MDNERDDRTRGRGARDGGVPGYGSRRGGRPADRESGDRPGRAGGASTPPGFGARRPVGIDSAERSAGALPPSARRPSRARPRRPDLPDGEPARLPRGVVGEIRRHSNEPEDVLLAVSGAVAALEDEDHERAVELLGWAKDQAPRAPSIRETLAIGHYLAGDFAAALRELNTYRRITGRTDQNHLIADCLRASGRPVSAVADAVQEMDAGRDGVERVVEGVIIWSSALADAGDPGAGRAVLERVLPAVTEAADRDERAPEHALRLWYVAGDLAERDAEPAAAIAWLERVADADPDLFDVGDRLRALLADEVGG